MANDFCEILVTAGELSREPAALSETAGAVVEFLGVVRAEESGAEIYGIEYEVFQAMAEHQLRVIAEAVHREFQLERVIVHHRVGFVAKGEPSVRVIVYAGHRLEAFAGCATMIDRLKKTVPIWKEPKAFA
jgi:molybdopterin synthase catalytic subunit